MRSLMLLPVLAGSPALSADLAFCWTGANGYVVEGYMTVPDAALSQPLVTEADVTAFAITGYQDGQAVGSWSLGALTARTTWNLNLDPSAMAFVTGGYSNTPRGQAWNADGGVSNCGTPGFGFNSGAGGQDVCVNGEYRVESMIPADTPLPVYPVDAAPPCLAAPIIGDAPIAGPGATPPSLPAERT